MDIKAGDKVKFLNDTGSGTLIRITKRGMGIVVREDGFEVPYPVKELILDQGITDYDEVSNRKKKTKASGKESSLPKTENQVGGKITGKNAEKPLKPIRTKKTIPATTEIDLHINTILNHTKEYSSGELVEIQLGKFETSLIGAIQRKEKKVVFIHGSGSGMLKYRIRKLLDDRYPDLRYQDASFKDYGYGATLVIIR